MRLAFSCGKFFVDIARNANKYLCDIPVQPLFSVVAPAAAFHAL